MKKFISVILIIAMFLIQSIGVFASNDIDVSEKITDDNAYLNDEEVKLFTNYYVQRHLITQFSYEKNDFKINEKYVKLYDLDGNHFAYLMHFTTLDEKHDGIITIGALKDGIIYYELSKDSKLIDAFNNYQTESIQEKIIYVPPFAYFTSSKDTNSYEAFGSSINNINIISKSDMMLDSTIGLTSKVSYNDIYSTLKSSDIKKYNNELLKILSANSVEFESHDTMRYNNSAYLSKWAEGQFIPVEYGAFYGGDQEWYGSNGDSNGCGPTAAANITAYLDDKNPSAYGELYRWSGLTQAHYEAHMIDMYNHMKPVNHIYGLTNVSDFFNYVKSFAANRSVILNGRYMTAKGKTESTTKNFIVAGLNNDTPVAALNLSLPGSFKYAWHWVTITGYEDAGQYDSNLIISTWGLKKEVNFHLYFTKGNQNGGGYAYFY